MSRCVGSSPTSSANCINKLMDRNRLLELAGVDSSNKIDEGLGSDEVYNTLFKLAEQADAARRGLGIANKLRDPADRRKHRSRIMTNLNRMRALIRKAEQALDAELNGEQSMSDEMPDDNAGMM